MATNSTTTAAPAKVETVTLRQIAETLSESHELPKKQVMSMLEDMVQTLTKHLKRGARIRIGGLGVLQVRKRPARMGRNPATGKAIKIKASKKIAFRAAKDLKEAVERGGVGRSRRCSALHVRAIGARGVSDPPGLTPLLRTSAVRDRCQTRRV